MLPAIVCLAALAVLLFAERVDSSWGRAVSKMVASSAFVWAAVVWGAEATVYGQLLLLGLVLCWLGDAFLLPAGRGVWFLAGLVSFLLGHLVYALAFVQLALEPIPLGICMVMVGGAAWWILRWLRPHLPSNFQWPVFAYVAAISLMLTLALAVSFSGGPWAIGLGAFGFAASDASVARNRFISQGFNNLAWGVPAYFISQLVLAYSVTQVV